MATYSGYRPARRSGERRSLTRVVDPATTAAVNFGAALPTGDRAALAAAGHRRQGCRRTHPGADDIPRRWAPWPSAVPTYKWRPTLALARVVNSAITAAAKIDSSSLHDGAAPAAAHPALTRICYFLVMNVRPYRFPAPSDHMNSVAVYSCGSAVLRYEPPYFTSPSNLWSGDRRWPLRDVDPATTAAANDCVTLSSNERSSRPCRDRSSTNLKGAPPIGARVLQAPSLACVWVRAARRASQPC
ncbi:hypothetical protein HYPSUDRAFT_46732 [Hypholoma sublateritium FD-334 SS-4]|uniref:Uncharacterized protein n=1 Tax=Hypholoma sublateritium (strain FD-334 SS-4) TaxID=945553 RepID=A0A0D2NKK4_HYPSF|nr:hypothetical protein HYPSUDRAFT_46732 [Hypholoma sublateritium FD-334 SS-4]